LLCGSFVISITVFAPRVTFKNHRHHGERLLDMSHYIMESLGRAEMPLTLDSRLSKQPRALAGTVSLSSPLASASVAYSSWHTSRYRFFCLMSILPYASEVSIVRSHSVVSTLGSWTSHCWYPTMLSLTHVPTLGSWTSHCWYPTMLSLTHVPTLGSWKSHCWYPTMLYLTHVPTLGSWKSHCWWPTMLSLTHSLPG